MLHNDVAQQRPGEQPASAPKTSQQSPRAQTAAKFKIPTLKQEDSRHEDTVKTGLRDGITDTTRPIHIHGRHSPPSPGQLTTHAIRPRTQHPESMTARPQPEPMYKLQPVQYHSFGKGHVQANSVFGPELGTGQHQPSCQEAEAKLQHPQNPTTILPHKSMPTPQPTRHHPSGEGHVQACSASGLEHSTEQQQLHHTETEAMLQYTHGRTEISPMPPLPRARYHPLEEGHGHARSVLRPECGAETQRPNQYRTIDLQHIRDVGKTVQKLTESDLWRHQHSYADSDTHSMYNTSSAVQHSLKRIESQLSATKGKTTFEASSSLSAQVQPFGNGHGLTDTTAGPVQSSKHSLQNLATQERQGQILHQERAAANLGPRSYLTGDSFAQQNLKTQGNQLHPGHILDR